VLSEFDHQQVGHDHHDKGEENRPGSGWKPSIAPNGLAGQHRPGARPVRANGIQADGLQPPFRLILR